MQEQASNPAQKLEPQPAALADVSTQPQVDLQQLAKHLGRIDGELHHVREMTEQLEACLLDDLRDLGVRLDAAEAANSTKQADISQAKADVPEALGGAHSAHINALKLQALTEKRLRRVEVTMAGMALLKAASPA